MPLEVALGKVNFPDARTRSLGTSGETTKGNRHSNLLFWARENEFLYGSGKWQFSLIISTNHTSCTHLLTFGISLSSTPRHLANRFQWWLCKWGLGTVRKPGWNAWSSDMNAKKPLGHSASWRFKEGPHKCSSLTYAPPFLVSPTHLSGRAGPYSNARRGELRKQGHEVRGERAICTWFPNRENTQAPGTQITDNCWRNASCQVFLQWWPRRNTDR